MNLLKGPLEIKAKPIWHNKISRVDTSIILSIDSDVKWPTLPSIHFSYSHSSEILFIIININFMLKF